MAQSATIAFAQNLVDRFIQFKQLEQQQRQFDLREKRYADELQANRIYRQETLGVQKKVAEARLESYKRPAFSGFGAGNPPVPGAQLEGVSVSERGGLSQRWGLPETQTVTELADRLYDITVDEDTGEPREPSDSDMLALQTEANAAGYQIRRTPTPGKDPLFGPPVAGISEYTLEKIAQPAFGPAEAPEAEMTGGTTESPYPEYPDAFLEDGVWKVIQDGTKYRIEE